MAKRDSLQPRQPLAATGTSAEDWQLVFDELAAAIGEDGRTAGETCPVLLAMVGREPSDAAAVCQHVGTDSWAVASVGIAEAAAPKNTIPLSPQEWRGVSKSWFWKLRRQAFRTRKRAVG